ncbi:MAG: hypothetical protein HBSAPP03_06910 [Phycisphaerae bacterium]|nr:MAG: hypothetical protein HBSAPP03_06910 [Phycisphaerae bacterium]
MLLRGGTVLAFLTSAALAQSVPPAPNDAPPDQPSHDGTEDARWTIRFEPAVWFAGLSGDVTLPRADEDSGGNQPTRLRDLGQNRTARLTPFGEVSLRRGNWGFALRGFALASDESAPGRDGMIGDIPIADGDAISSSVTFAAAELEALYTLVKGQSRPMEGGGYWLRPRLDLVFGLRALQADWSVRNLDAEGPDSASADELALHPLVGIKAGAVIRERFALDVQLAAGGMPFLENSSFGFDILVGGSCEIIPHVGVQLGYRALFFSISSGDGDAQFEFSGAVQGLYAGLAIEF